LVNEEYRNIEIYGQLEIAIPPQENDQYQNTNLYARFEQLMTSLKT